MCIYDSMTLFNYQPLQIFFPPHFHCSNTDIKEWWINVYIVKGRETEIPKFRIVRKKQHENSDGVSKWESKWHVAIRDPTVLGRLNYAQERNCDNH